MVPLPLQSHTDHLKSLTSCLFYENITKHGGRVFLVGGGVRDKLLCRPVKDIDLIVTGLPFPALTTLLKKTGLVSLVGKAFGVIKFRPRESPDHEIDIALPRSEQSTGNGHRDFDVHFDPLLPIEIDLGRRDFTINAMAQDMNTGDMIDPFGGCQDLAAGLIRTVFHHSFVEDPLRLLRAVQFAARFSFAIAGETYGEMVEHAPLIHTVSPERVITEIKKLFSAPVPSMGFDLMRQTGLLNHVFPDIAAMVGVRQPRKKDTDVYDHTMKVLDAARTAEELEQAGDINIMMAALFHDAGKPKTRREDPSSGEVSFYNHHLISAGIAGRWMHEYRVTTAGIDPGLVCHLIKNHMFETVHFEKNEKALRRFITRVEPEHIFKLLDLRLADKKGGRFPKKVYGITKLRETIRAEMAKKPPFTAKDLAINGHDIMALGFLPGPVIGDIQRFLMEKVLDEPALNTKDTLTKLIQENFQCQPPMPQNP